MIVSSRPRDVLVAFATGAVSLALYVATLQPDFGGPEDTPKFQFIGYVLGIPHPPGYPLYVLLSHAFVAIPIGTIAYRANLFSAVMAAIACALTFVLARQLGARRWTSLCAALGLATGASFWRSAVFAEVYSLAAVMAALTMTLLLAWGARGGAGRLLAAVAAFALGLGNHLTIIGLAPAFALYVWFRERRLPDVRIMACCALVLLIGAAQYALVVVRTHQGAPYLETRAGDIAGLVGVVTAERFAGQRFAFGPAVLLTDHLPALAAVIARELGIIGTIMFVAGVVAGVRRAERARALVLLGAAAGMFAMLLNLSGDLKGFITPLMVLMWPLAAVGVEALAAFARSMREGGAIAAGLALATAAAMPVVNAASNYRLADQSRQTNEARFLRAAFNQLPEGAAFVAEDYWSDMALHYFRFTGEAGPRGGIARAGFDAAEVRQAAREGRRVFAFATAATFLAAEGLTFRRTAVDGVPLEQWLALLPSGSVVTGATVYGSAPDLSSIGHPNATPAGRPRSFEAFLAVVGRGAAARRREDDATSIAADAGLPGVTLPPFAGALLASADASQARIDLGGRTIARVGTGLALAVFAPDGALVRALEFPAGVPQRVQYSEAMYELAGESPCVRLTTGEWADIGGLLAGGSWVATMGEVGTVVVDSVFPEARDVQARSSVLLGEGRMRTSIAHDLDGDIMSTELTRSGESRPVFRLAIDRPLTEVHARVQPGGSQSSATLCAHREMRPLFDEGSSAASLRADFESEAYFGAGWGDAERSPTGPVRRGEDGASLFLPLEAGRDFRMALDLSADVALPLMKLMLTLNGFQVGDCDAHGRTPCTVTLPSVLVRRGVNTLTLSPDLTGRQRQPFIFRGARIEKIRIAADPR